MKSHSIELASGVCRLKLNSSNGRIESFTMDGEELVEPAEQLFTLGLRDASGDLEVLSSNDFETMELAETPEGGLMLEFSEHKEHDEFAVAVAIRMLGNSFYWQIAVSGQDRKLMLEWFDCPQVVVDGRLAGRGGEGYIFQPIAEGVLIDNPRVRAENQWLKYRIQGFQYNGATGLYPGLAQMQFLAYYNDRAGVYFAAHDPTDCTKAVEVDSEDADRARLSLQTFCGQEDLDSYICPFEFVLTGFKGDWMDAAEIYRNWAVTDTHLPPKLVDNPRMPEWFADSPVVLFYPVRGDGDDKGDMGPNEYFPFVKAMPMIEQYGQELDSRIMPVLMHWEGTAPWAPPYVWPPYGGEEGLAEFRDKLHASGHLLGLYCSGTAWTQTSSIIDYSREEQFKEENLKTEMCRGPKGEIDAVICNGPKGAGQRMGYECCVDREWTKETVTEEVLKMARFGADYSQFFDQNLGGAVPFCYSGKHDHPAVPGKWQVDAMLDLCERIDAGLDELGTRMLLGCEAAAAQPYLKYMNCSDLRSANAFWTGSMPVPAYAYVFHEYVNNFMGNQNGLDGCMDMASAPWNLLYRTAYCFNAGDMMALMLKDHGDIHWCWVMKWDRPAPDQQSIRTLVRNLNYWRQNRGKPYLVYGKMIKPLVKVECGKLEWYSKVAKSNLEFDSVLTSCWQAPDGTRAQFVTNFLPEKQKVTLHLPPSSGIAIYRMDGTHLGRRGTFEVELEPLQAIMLHREHE